MNARTPRTTISGSLELRIWLRLLRCSNTISRHLRRNLKDTFSLSLPRFDLLAQVGRPPLGPSLGELSRRLLVTKGNITDIVTRLEAEELIERQHDERDGRIQYVFLTESGEALLNDILPAHDQWLRELLSEMNREEQDTLYQALGILSRALQVKETKSDTRGNEQADSPATAGAAPVSETNAR